eukprot:maker-scaffold_13-snap-gene-11.0-mRNA-1 protein AED:0.01 eAED:0.01 QI:26/0.5/0.66/1/1/1/3/175/325
MEIEETPMKRKKTNISSSRALIHAWCQQCGVEISETFVETVTVKDRSVDITPFFICELHYLEDEHKVKGGVFAVKKQAINSAYEKMWSHIKHNYVCKDLELLEEDSISLHSAGRTLPSFQSKLSRALTEFSNGSINGHYRSRLDDWAKKAHKKNFRQLFEVETSQEGNMFQATLKLRGTDVEKYGYPARSKKETLYDACKKMWVHIEQEVRSNKSKENNSGVLLKYDALIGDKILDFLLVLYYDEQVRSGNPNFVEHAAEMQKFISARSSNENLMRKMGEFGLEYTGHSVNDPSNVEKWVKERFYENRRDIQKTMNDIKTLFENK